MKKLFLTILSIVALTVTVSAMPTHTIYGEEMMVDGIEGDSIYFLAELGLITAFGEQVTVANIPSQIQGVDVIEIDYYALDSNSQLTAVALPSTITEVSGGTFGYCSALETITVDADNPYLMAEDGVLFSKDGTTLVRYPAGKTGTSYQVPDSVTTIAPLAFGRCSGLENVILPDGVEELGVSAFIGCSNLEAIAIPAGVEVLESNIFEGCSALASVTLVPGLKTISASAFSSCTSLEELILPHTLEEIWQGVFWNCTDLEQLYIPANVTYVGYHTFADCPATVYYGGTRDAWQEASEILEMPELVVHCPSDWAAETVDSAHEAGILPAFVGAPAFTDTTTRLQFAQLIVAMVETVTEEEIPLDDSAFTDCTDTAALKAAAVGIVTGYDDGSFKPDTPTTRQQIATMIDRAITYMTSVTDTDLAPETGDLSAFTDAGNVAAYAQEAVARLAANGIMNGTSTTTLSPGNPCTVQQSIVLVYRLFGLAQN